MFQTLFYLKLFYFEHCSIVKTDSKVIAEKFNYNKVIDSGLSYFDLFASFSAKYRS